MHTQTKTISASVMAVAIILALGLLLCFVAVAQSVTNVNLIENGDFLGGDTDWEIRTTGPKAHVEARVVSATVGPNRYAMHCMVTNTPPDNAWNVTLNQILKVTLTKDDILVAKVWLRSPDFAGVNVIVKELSERRVQPLCARFDPTPEWKEYTVRGVSYNGLINPDKEYQFCIPQSQGTVEIAGVRLFRMMQTEN
jgi:hypothetical protein